MNTKSRNIFDVTGKQSLSDIVESIRLCDLECSKVEMAENLGVSKSYYGDFVAGRAAVSVSRAVEWAAILGHSKKVFVKYALDDLLERNDVTDLIVEVKEAK